jgi:ubiquinone/menaquinone biosynthesis C-methylase UbiE
MMPAKFFAKQLSHPSGILGRFVLPRAWNKRNSALNEVALNSLALRPGDRVLEVGFGGGHLLSRMADVITDGFLAGVDVSPAMVAFCEKRYRSLVREGKLELRCARAEALPYPSAYFSKACSVNSIFYWQNASQAISELWRVLAEGGMLVLCFTCKGSLEKRGFANSGITLYAADEVQQMMETSGFHPIRMMRASDKHREFLCAVGSK